jgi:hypothetical protein
MWKKAFFFLSFLFLVGLSYKFYLGSYINSKLCLNKPVKDADLLIVEGWLEDEELKKASELFTSDKYKYIVTTGVLESQFFKMGMNGDLVFNVRGSNIPTGNHKLSVEAFSTMARGEGGIFSAWINNEKVGEAVTSNIPYFYSFSFKSYSKIDSISIRFLNDALYKNQDINFYLASVSIDSTKFYVNDTLNYYRIKRWPEVKHRLAKTNDLRSKFVLMRYHIPENKIIAISTSINSESRTQQTAKNTLISLGRIFNTDTLRINVFSRTIHSRRTYLAYKKYYGKIDQLGIISCHIPFVTEEKGCLKKLKEIMGILYIMISPK